MAPSVTAQGVARARSLMIRPSSPTGDPEGEALLNADLAIDVAGAPGPLFHHLVARTRFFDELTIDSIARGSTQVVIVGAGYDGRGLRFRTTGVRFFEIDLPDTQRDKQERLARLGVAGSDIAYVPLDLASGAVEDALRAAGHDENQPSVFFCEGLLLYLDCAVVERLFRSLRRCAVGSATLALSLSVRDRAATDPGAAIRRAFFHRRLRRLGEPPRTSLTRGEWEALLARTGWSIDRAVDPHDLDAEASSGTALLVTASPVAGSA